MKRRACDMDQSELRVKAELGDRQAQYHLGKLIQDAAYANDAIYETSLKEAFKLYRMSALQSFAPAQLELGRMYILGEGVKGDKDKGIEWLKKAAAQGSTESEFEIADAIELEDVEQSRSEEIFECYKRAAEHGHVDAQHKLGECYELGRGIPVNDAEAFCWYLRAAELGSWDGMFDVGRCYVTGIGTSKNPDEALRWLLHFADPRITKAIWFMYRAQIWISKIFLDAEHCRVDDVEAYKWLNLAATYLPQGEELFGMMSSEEERGYRDTLAGRMTNEQLREGQRRSAEMFIPKKEIQRRIDENRAASA